MNLGKNVERNEKPLKHEKCSQRNTFILRVLKKRKHSLQKFPPPGNENKKSKKKKKQKMGKRKMGTKSICLEREWGKKEKKNEDCTKKKHLI